MTPALQHTDWLTGRVPDGVRAQIRRLVEVLGYLPHVQPLCILTPDSVLLAANEPLLDLLGTSGDELLGGDWSDVMPAWEGRVRGWDDGEPRTHTFEDRVLPAGGRELWTHVVASPVLTEGGPRPQASDGGPSLAAWALFVSDRSPADGDPDERSRREVLDMLLESPGEFVVKLDREGRLEFTSPSLCRAVGRTREELLGQPLEAAHPDAAAHRRELADLWAALSTPPYRARREMVMQTPAGERSVSWTFEALIADRGAVRGALGLGRDVTERRQAEVALERRLGFESMLVSVSSRLTDATLETMDLTLEFVLGEVGRAMGVDAVAMYELGVDRSTVTLARVWRREAAAVTCPGEGTLLAKLPWLREQLAAHRVVEVGELAGLPPEAAAEREVWAARGVRSLAVAPLSVDGLLYGYLELGMSTATRAWSADDLHVLRLLADQLAGELIWYRDAQHLTVLSETFLSFGPECEQNLAAICAAAGAVTGADFALYNRRRGDDLVLVAGWNTPGDLPGVTRAQGRVCHDVMSAAEDDVRVIADLPETVYAHTSPIVKKYGLRTYAGYPVKADGRAVATLCVMFMADVVLRESQLELLRVLGRAAAVEEARRLANEDRLLGLAQLEQAMERIVATLSGAMSTRDPYTAGHEGRVAQLAAAIGAALGLADSELRLLRLAATVHDIGKIAVPAELLSKPNRLSGAEFAVIQLHCEAGYDLLQPAGLPDVVMDAVLHHHERLDGSGYPHGLCGEAIGMFPRVLAVADVAEAMSSDRPYRPALGVEPALEEIAEGRGTRYDPSVCDACLRLFRSEGFRFDG